MSRPAEFVELLGFSLFSPPPISEIHLRVMPGLSVLYGLNGAGKTRILSSLVSAFEGIREGGASSTGPRIHCRVRRTEDAEGARSPLAEAIRTSLEEMVESLAREFPRARFFDSAAGLSIRDLIETWVTMNVSIYGELDSDAFTGADVARELAEQCCFTILPTGTREMPSWELMVAAQVDDSVPALSEALKHSMTSEGGGPVEFDEGFLLEWWPDAFPPPWVPLPFDAASESFDAKEHLPFRVLHERNLDPNSITISAYSGMGRFIHSIDEEGSVTWASSLTEFLNFISARATDLVDSLLLDAPALVCEANHPEEWYEHPPLSWRGLDRPSLSWVPLESLSSAQKRWSTISIFAAMITAVAEQSADDFGLVLLDEPELALHALAERQVVRGLRDMAAENGWPILVTTHSREFLNDPDVLLHRVFRDDLGFTRVNALLTPLAPEAEPHDLGIEKSDLLQAHRVFLLVEGEHDRAMVESLIGDELASARTGVIPVRGIRNVLSLAEAEFLFSFSDAIFVAVLDRVRMEGVHDRWTKTKHSYALSHDAGKAMRFLDQLRTSPREEERVLYALCHRALEAGEPRRLTVFGFREPDIIHYLPVSVVDPDASSWQELVSRWRRGGSEPPFKEWLAQETGWQATSSSIREAASTMDHIPQEFTALSNLASDLSRLAGRVE